MRKLILTLFTALCLAATSFAQIKIESKSAILYQYDEIGDSLAVKKTFKETNLIYLANGVLTIKCTSCQGSKPYTFKTKDGLEYKEAQDAEGNEFILLQGVIKDNNGRTGIVQFTLHDDNFVCMDLMFENSIHHFGKITDLTEFDDEKKGANFL